MVSDIREDYQSFSPGNIVELFTLDCTVLGGGVYHFSPAAHKDGNVSFGGVEYVAAPVEAEGFELNGKGQLPRPKIRISNVAGMATALLNTHGDILNATVTRIKTLSKYLDGAAEADPDMHFPIDVFKIERRSNHNKTMIEWELTSAMDQDGRMLPGRQLLRDVCMKRYRVWNPILQSFDYTRATCPYADEVHFDKLGQSVDNPAQDRCGKRLSDCRKRFGTRPKPFGGFPGVARTTR